MNKGKLAVLGILTILSGYFILRANISRSIAEDANASKAKCQASIDPLKAEKNLLVENIQRLETSKKENKLELARCEDEKRKCLIDSGACQAKLASGTREGCRQTAEAKMSNGKYYLLNVDINPDLADCESAIAAYSNTISELRKTEQELKELKDTDSIKECQEKLDKCHEDLNSCEIEYREIPCK